MIPTVACPGSRAGGAPPPAIGIHAHEGDIAVSHTIACRLDRRRGAWLGATLALLLGTATPALAQDGGAGTGFVYAMTNNLSGNEILAYPRAEDGTLGSPVHYETGGIGSGSFKNSDTALIVAGAEG